MLEQKGDILKPDKSVDAICISTNTCIDKNGCAIMGAGLALQVKNKFPDSAKFLGIFLSGIKQGLAPKKRIILIHSWNLFFDKNIDILAFQTKENWKYRSNIYGIMASARELIKFSDMMGYKKIWLPRVGCGCGCLKWDQIKSELSKILDDRFVVVNK